MTEKTKYEGWGPPQDYEEGIREAAARSMMQKDRVERELGVIIQAIRDGYSVHQHEMEQWEAEHSLGSVMDYTTPSSQDAVASPTPRDKPVPYAKLCCGVELYYAIRASRRDDVYFQLGRKQRAGEQPGIYLMVCPQQVEVVFDGTFKGNDWALYRKPRS